MSLAWQSSHGFPIGLYHPAALPVARSLGGCDPLKVRASWHALHHWSCHGLARQSVPGGPTMQHLLVLPSAPKDCHPCVKSNRRQIPLASSPVQETSPAPSLSGIGYPAHPTACPPAPSSAGSQPSQMALSALSSLYLILASCSMTGGCEPPVQPNYRGEQGHPSWHLQQPWSRHSSCHAECPLVPVGGPTSPTSPPGYGTWLVHSSPHAHYVTYTALMSLPRNPNCLVLAD